MELRFAAGEEGSLWCAPALGFSFIFLLSLEGRCGQNTGVLEPTWVGLPLPSPAGMGVLAMKSSHQQISCFFRLC